ncbi:cyclic peptide export ABC transporter [Paenibacillus macquariensis]|uniref:cyclic peptide export ABC transporter n=1 Tax=Paenibacillus macquariensis TaxID=948756 RepID=UPI001FCDB1F4|nr:cyclic peptide export ABC transporter [Paenibacillus macquariensis]
MRSRFQRVMMACLILCCAGHVLVSMLFANRAEAAGANDLVEQHTEKIEKFINENMKKGNIPGMTVVIVQGNETVYSKSFGYADVNNKIKVTQDTSFEIASNSKAFTGLAVLELEKAGLLTLDDPISKFFAGFKTTYKGKPYEITLRQLLHHSSGMPWYTITNIPISDHPDALEEVVNNVNGMRLDSRPGEQFQYATINYAIIGAVIEKVTGQPFEEYMEKNVFQPLGLKHTTVYPEKATSLALGYKNGFFKAREYEAPIFRGNRPAGYIMMDGNDLALWLKYQLGSIQTPLTPLIMETHVPDRTVKPSRFDYSSYAMGWADYQSGNGELSKAGLNPNFSAYMVLRPQDNLAVGIMANSGTTLTYITGHGVMDILRVQDPTSPYEPDRKADNSWSIITILAMVYVLSVVGLLAAIIIGIVRKKRIWKPLNFKKIASWLAVLASSLPFIYGIYLIPKAMQGVSWTTAIVWSPFSFLTAIGAVCVGVVLSFVYMVLSTLFPNSESDIGELPSLVMLGIMSGLANAFVIFIVNFSISSNIALKYLLYYFALALVVYIFGRRVIEGRLVKITYNMIYRKRMELIQHVLRSSYQKMEKIDNGRVLATLNNDTEMIGYSSSIVVGFATSLLTVICCFVYLGTITFWGMLLSLVVIVAIAILYSLVSATANRYWEEARDTQNVYLGFIDHLLKGFKELSMHRRKKFGFQKDVEASCEKYREKRIVSRIKFTNALVVGEMLLILILGTVTFAFPVIFKDIQDHTLISFVIVFLYMIGPMNGLLQAIPEIIQIRTSLKRIEGFIEEVAASEGNLEDPLSSVETDLRIERIGFHNLSYEYQNSDGESSFLVGPLSFEVECSQIVFITGGNGSGKTTFGKLVTALYSPKEGHITVNGKVINPRELSEYISVVFSDYHLFDKLYEIDCAKKQPEIEHYLKLLELHDKVSIKDGVFSTVDLSGGQRKRLALLVCYLEDRPIYLFDEWAADQDPEFRKFFYRTLLPEMKEAGKIVIAITHDDHYFHVADLVLQMEMGQLKIKEVNASLQIS